MLQEIREKTQGWIAGTVIGILILTFALWGIHSYFSATGGNTTVATINGTDITKDQLNSTYERMRRQAQAQYGSVTNPANESALRERALHSLIDVEVLKQASLKQGFLISDQQVDDYLQSMPDFQVNGQFSIDRFQEVLSTTMLTTSEFLDIIKTTLQIDQPRLGVMLTAFSTPEETQYTAELVNQVRDIEALNLPVANFLNQPIVISPDQIEAYYKAHQDNYKTPEQVSLDYIELSLPQLYSRFNPTDSMLKSFYNENINAYTETGEKPKIQPFEVVKAKVRDAYVRQHAEEKFAELRDQLAEVTYEHPDSLADASSILNLPVKTSSLFTRDKGSDEVSRSRKVRDAAFGNDVLNLQTNSDVIELSSDKVVVVRLKSHLASSLLPLNDVSKQIVDKLKNETAEKMALKFASDLTAILRSGSDAGQLIAKYRLQWKQLGTVGRYAKQVDSAVLENAFQLPAPVQGRISYGITRVPNGYTIVGVKRVTEGKLQAEKEESVFNEQVQNSLGYLEYTLYRQSQIKQAKVKIIS